MKSSTIIRAAQAHLDANPEHSARELCGGYWFCNYLRNDSLTVGIGMYSERERAAACVVDAITEAMFGDTGSNTFMDLYVHKGWGTTKQANDRTHGSHYYEKRKEWLLALADQLQSEGD